MTRYGIWSACAIVVAMGCATPQVVVPTTGVEEFPVERVGDLSILARVTSQSDNQVVLQLRTAHRETAPFYRGRVDVLRAGEVVTTTMLDQVAAKQGLTELMLDPGSYEVTVTSSDGTRTVVLTHVTVLRSHCFAERSNDEIRPAPRPTRAFGYHHFGTRVVFNAGKGNPRLAVPRVVAAYGFARPTHITWQQGSARTVTTFRSERATWTHSASVESSLGDALYRNCGRLWEVDTAPYPIPDEVWRAGGRWTARLVSPGAATVEVEFEAGDGIAIDRRFGRYDPRRSPNLPARVVETTDQERAWQAEEESQMRIDPPRVRAAFVPPLPITPAIFRAAHRSVDIAFDYHRYTLVGLPTSSPYVDVVADIRQGVRQGDTVAVAEQRARRYQARLDANARDENAYRKKEARRLRTKLEVSIQKHGGPFEPHELPDPFSPPPAQDPGAELPAANTPSR